MSRPQQSWILLVLALVGVLAITVPALVESGLGGRALREISVNAGVGLLASLLVLTLTSRFGAVRRADSLEELLHDLGRRPIVGTAHLATEIRDSCTYAEELRALGVERIYRSRSDAYEAIAAEMSTASRIHILSGCMQTFWGIHRDVLLERDRAPGTDVVVLLMDPESVHLASRTAIDDRFLPDTSRQMLEGFAAASRQISGQLRECYLYDYCAPASTWLVDDSIYVTPRFYSTPGGRGFCVKLRRTPNGLYDEVRATLEAAIEDAKQGVRGLPASSASKEKRRHGAR